MTSNESSYGPSGVVRVAADDEDVLGRADLLQAAEELLELRLAAEPAGGDVRDGDEAELRTALAAATRISRSSLPRNVTLILCRRG